MNLEIIHHSDEVILTSSAGFSKNFSLFLIIFIFRFFSYLNRKNISKNEEENVIDLEKDPKSDEYKPKE